MDDLRVAASNASLIKFPAASAEGQGGTNLHAAAAAAALMVTARKSKATMPTTYVVVLLTDAVENNRKTLTGRVETLDYRVPIVSPSVVVEGGANIQTLAPDLCDGIKSAGAEVMVLNTEYVTDGYGTYAASAVKNNLKPYMPERFAMCASAPEYVKSANDPDAIISGAVEFARLALARSLRITN